MATDRSRVDPVAPDSRWGTGEWLALLASVCYATVNALLRSVATDVDPFVASLVRQVPLLCIGAVAVAVVRPRNLAPRHADFIGTRAVVLLMVGGVVSFVIGNVLLMQGLSWVGLAVATAALQGGMVVGGALISWLALREPPSRAQTVGVVTVIAGLAVMAGPTMAAALDWRGVVGLLFSATAGACYTANGAVSRAVQRRRKAFLTTLVLTNLGGVLVLAAVVAVREGADLATALTTTELAVLLIAGTVNAVAIGAITLAVRHTSVASTSMVSASVIVMGTIVAATVFHEPTGPALLAGCAVIIAGILVGPLSRRPAPARAIPSQGAQP